MNRQKKKTILLVEDDEILSLINQEWLEKYGYKVLTAVSGKAAISIISDSKAIDCILMDIDLGDELDGIQTAEIILANNDIPLLFLSNHDEAQTLEQIERVNSYGYIPKNSGIPIIDTSIKMALKLFAANQKIKESEAQNRFLFEQTNCAILIVDANGKFTDANQTACILLGYTYDEILKLSIPDTQLEEDLIPQRLKLDEMRAKGKLVNIRRFRRKDGSIFIGEINALLRADNYIQATIRDITEQTRKDELIQESNKKLELAHIDILQRQFAIDQHAIVAITDIAGTIVYVNEKFCEISGYSSYELIGQNHRLINSGYHSLEFFQDMYSTLKQGIAWHGEIRNRAKDGTYYWVATTIALIKNTDGRIDQYFAIRTDITNRKLAEERLLHHKEELEAQNMELTRTHSELELVRARYFDLYDLAPVGYFSTDKNKLILEANLTLASMLDANQSALLGTSIYEFICDSDHDTIHYLYQILNRTKKTKSCELRMRKTDRSEFWVRLDATAFSFEDGTFVTRIAITNISKRKAVEKELNQYMKALEDTNKTKNKFFNIIAHDLRNPFSGIIGISDMLENKLKETDIPDSALLLRYTNLIQSSSKSAYTLLENLLLWARSQTGDIKIIPRPIDLNHLISFTIPIVFGNAFKKNITIETEVIENGKVLADEFSVCTILRNLLTNAIKFTYPNGKIIVSTKNTEDSVEVSITDTGMGIDPKHIENLFRIDSKFSKLGTDNEKGTGLGLILCKEFAERQGGTIYVTSELGIGSTFTFTLPLASPSDNNAYNRENISPN